MVRWSDDGMYSTAIMKDRAPVCRIGGCGEPKDAESPDGLCAEHHAAVTDVRSRLRKKPVEGRQSVWVLDEPEPESLPVDVLRAELLRAGITHKPIAAEAGCRRSNVGYVLQGRRENPVIIRAAHRLLQAQSTRRR
jgi:hypothetical protein